MEHRSCFLEIREREREKLRPKLRNGKRDSVAKKVAIKIHELTESSILTEQNRVVFCQFIL